MDQTAIISSQLRFEGSQEDTLEAAWQMVATMEALVLKRSSLVMPGLRGTPAQWIQRLDKGRGWVLLEPN